MQDVLQIDVSPVSPESEDEEDTSDVPHSLGLSINLSLLLYPPTSASTTSTPASTTPTHTHWVDQHLEPTHVLLRKYSSGNRFFG